MNKAFTLPLLLMLGISSYAKTNIFPNNGFVGIGTTSPNWPLTVNGMLTLNRNDYQTVHLRPNAGYPGYVYWAEAGVAEHGILGFNAGSGDLVYRSGSYSFLTGTERFRITQGGMWVSGSHHQMINWLYMVLLELGKLRLKMPIGQILFLTNLINFQRLRKQKLISGKKAICQVFHLLQM